MRHKNFFLILFQRRLRPVAFRRLSFVFLIVLCFFAFSLEKSALGQEISPAAVSLTSIIEPVTNNDSLFIAGTISHKLGVRGYRVYHNYETIISRETPPKLSLKFAHLLSLREGLNKIEIIPINPYGDLSGGGKVIEISYQRGIPKLWAVFIGVGKYKSADVTPCHLCIQDANAFADRMEEWAPDYLQPYILRPIKIIGKHATRSNIRRELTMIRRQAGPEDIIILYFAGISATISEGRGLSGVSHYILPYDVKPTWEDLPFTAISVTELARQLVMSGNRAYAVFDTSFSWREKAALPRSMHIKQSLTKIDRRNIRKKLLANQWIEELSSGGKIQVLASSRGLEGAHESMIDKHGIFTLYLLDLFKGKGDLNFDGQITLEETFSYVYPKVRAATSETQSPMMMSQTSKSPSIAPGPVAEFPPPSIAINFEQTGHPGVVKIIGQIKSKSGLKGYRIEVGDIPVIHKKLSREIFFSLDEPVILRPYGERVSVIAEDIDGLETSNSIFLEYSPDAPYSEVSWQTFFDENKKKDLFSQEKLPSALLVRNARYDVQKILRDFEILLQNNQIEVERYRLVSSFWKNIMGQLDDYLNSSENTVRKKTWNNLREHMLEMYTGIDIWNFDYLQDIWTPEDHLQINLEISANNAGVVPVKYCLSANRVPVILKDLTDQPIMIQKFTHQIPLKVGKNQIEVSVTNSMGLSMKRSLEVTRQPLRELSALVIGVGKYADLPHLQFARRDAEEFSSYLLTRTTLMRNRISVLYNRDATTERIFESIKQMRRMRTRDSVNGPLVIYFSGLGSIDNNGNAYILPYDADPSEPAQTGIDVMELIDVIENDINPTDALLILDTSFIPLSDVLPDKFRLKSFNQGSSGQGSRLAKLTSTSELKKRLEGMLTAPPNWAILLSTNGEGFEPVQKKDRSGFQNSLFTHYLLQDLKDLNSDGELNERDLLRPAVVNLFNLFDRVKEKVWTDTKGRQCPELISNLHRPFSFQYLPPQYYRTQVRSHLFKNIRRIGSREWETSVTQKSRQLLLKSLDIDYDNGETHMLLGTLDSFDRNFDSVEMHFNYAIDSAKEDNKKAMYQIQWAYCNIKQGKYKRGIDLLDKILDLNLDQKTKLIAQIHYGYCLALAGEPLKAGQYLGNINKLIPTHDTLVKAIFWTRYGDLAFLNRDFNRAIEDYKYVERFGLFKELTSSNLAWANFARGNYEASDKHAQKSFSEDDYLNMLRYFSLNLLGRYDEAQKLLTSIRAPQQRTWSQNIVAFLLKESSSPMLLARAGADPIRQCRAYFYSALQALVEKDEAKAHELFQKAIGTEIYHIPEWTTSSAMASPNRK